MTAEVLRVGNGITEDDLHRLAKTANRMPFKDAQGNDIGHCQNARVENGILLVDLVLDTIQKGR